MTVNHDLNRNRSWLIRGGRIVDPANGRDEMADLLVLDGKIAEIGQVSAPDDIPVVDAKNLIVAPGLIDLHVHLRVPGGEYKETMATGTAAAAAGGFTAICCMPNTKPALDSVTVLEDLHQRIREEASIRVFPIATITRGRKGDEAVDFDALAAAGAIGFSDDGDTTANSAIMRTALEASKRLDRPVIVHCEDKALASGAMNEGEISEALKIPGIPAEAEEIIIARDLMLARLTGGWLHVCHVSTGRGIDYIRQAKANGINVTSEVMPHHLLMSDAWVAGDRTLLNVNEPIGNQAKPADPNTKVNPPLRTEADTRQLLAALQSGSFDIIATDHAPHAAHEKVGTTFIKAAFGLSGSEFALPLMLALVRAGHMTLSELITRISAVPAQLLRKPLGTLSIGAIADIVLFDPNESWIVTTENLKTKSANTPLLGMELRGRVRMTLVDGEERYHA